MTDDQKAAWLGALDDLMADDLLDLLEALQELRCFGCGCVQPSQGLCHCWNDE